MKIFNAQLNGLDAKWFCNLSKEEKVNWITENTSQKNLETINEFLLQPIDDSDCGCGCGGSKTIKDESSRISETIVKNHEVVDYPRGNSKISSGRRKKPKNS